LNSGLYSCEVGILLLHILVIFEIGSRFLPGLAWTVIFMLMLFIGAGMAGLFHHTQLFLLRWVS
jgi:hypothetical protein